MWGGMRCVSRSSSNAKTETIGLVVAHILIIPGELAEEMPRPHHRMNLTLVSAEPEFCPGPRDLEVFWGGLVADGWVDREGNPGPNSEQLVSGGFQRLRADHPPGRTLYANRIGGMQVRCPGCKQPLAGPLGGAMESWRKGGDGRVLCPGCGVEREVEELDIQPPMARGRFALEFRNVMGPELTPLGQQVVERLLGPGSRAVVSRG